MNGWIGDLKVAMRRLRRRRGLSAVATGTLALALGACLVFFSVFGTLLLEPLPYPDSNCLLGVSSLGPFSARSGTHHSGLFSAPDYLDLRRFSPRIGLAAYFYNVATLAGGSPPQHVAYTNVSGNFFAVMGVSPQLGRAVQMDDELPSVPAVAVLSHALWQQRFGSNPNVIGQGIRLDNQTLTVIGVMPPGFDFPAHTELWAPEPFTNAALQRRSADFLSLVARLRTPRELSAARGQLQSAVARLAAIYPDVDGGMGVTVEPLQDELDAPYRGSLWLLLLAGLVLFGVACANAANMLVAEATTRRREMAIRASLGASRSRLTLQLLTEGLVIAVGACVGGWLLALAVLPEVRRLHGAVLPQLSHVHLDTRVAGFGLLVTAATAIWLGLAPAWELVRPRPGRSLQAGLREDGRRSQTQAWVAGAEVAATVVLLVGAGLLWRTSRQLERVNPGFRTAHVLTFRASLLYSSMAELDSGSVYFRRLLTRLQQMPGVAAVGMISDLPLSSPQARLHFYVAGSSAGAALPETERPEAGVARLLPGYFAAAGIPLAGRDFNFGDERGAARVIIVSRGMAMDLFPHQNPIGQALAWGRGSDLVTARIVGVAGDVHQNGLAEPAGWELYEPYLQSPAGDMTGVVRTRGNPWSLQAPLRRAAAEVDPRIPLYQFATLQQPVDEATAPERFRAGLLLVLGGLALLLAAAGVYSVLAHGVAQRRREIGIRMALGASVGQLQAMIFAQALRICLSGAAVGLLVAAGLAELMRSLLFGVSVADPVTFIAAPGILIAVGVLASYLPARQAARVNPVIALRCE